MSIQNLPLCSICIANYNGMDTVVECIESVLAQSTDLPIEIIIHDDASTDKSVQLIKDRYPEAILIVSDENVGFCVSNNRMVDLAKGEFILLLNNDAVLFPDAIEILYKKSKQLNHEGILGLPQYDADNGTLIDRGSLFDPFYNPVPNTFVSRKSVGMIIGACLWIPEKIWNTIHGFPEWFDTLAEDMYLCCVARLWGMSVEVASESGFRHWVGTSLGGGKVLNRKLSTSLRRRKLSERNKSFVMYICTPTKVVYILMSLHLFVLGVEGLLLSFIKWDYRLFREIYLNCIIDIWRYRKKLSKERFRVQNLRNCTVVEYYKPVVWYPYKLLMLLRYGIPSIVK
ncbi:glycosyltransferase family 2 protein [Sedimenticola sp.]|uniref:glycosyltransferase family 2 protein n=1 Tax=Sedimenticola sp. TaxID=1940285 RepID=UPI003D1406B3